MVESVSIVALRNKWATYVKVPALEDIRYTAMDVILDRRMPCPLCVIRTANGQQGKGTQLEVTHDDLPELIEALQVALHTLNQDADGPPRRTG